MRRQGRDCSHFTDVDSKAERGKATGLKLHSCSVAEPGLGSEAPFTECRALSGVPCALEFLKPGEVWTLGSPLSEGAGGQAFRAHEPSGEGCGVGLVRGQDADQGRRGELHRTQLQDQDPDPRESGIEKRLDWTPYPRSPLFSGRDASRKTVN